MRYPEHPPKRSVTNAKPKVEAVEYMCAALSVRVKPRIFTLHNVDSRGYSEID
jgi:hypothetical protein